VSEHRAVIEEIAWLMRLGLNKLTSLNSTRYVEHIMTTRNAKDWQKKLERWRNRRKKIAALYASGKTMREIAKQMGVSAQAISQRLKDPRLPQRESPFSKWKEEEAAKKAAKQISSAALEVSSQTGKRGTRCADNQS
jgi:hypothetical protein